MSKKLVRHSLSVDGLLAKLALLMQYRSLSSDAPYAARAYDKAFQLIMANRSVNWLSLTVNELKRYPGIGPKLAGTIRQYALGNDIDELVSAESSICPSTVFELMKVPGVGAKTAYRLYLTQGIQNLSDLLKRARAGTLDSPTITESVLLLEERGFDNSRTPWVVMREILGRVHAALVGAGLVDAQWFSPAGSFRRCQDTCRDLDVLVSPDRDNRERLVAAFCQLGRVIVSGDAKSRIYFTHRTFHETYVVQIDLLLIKRSAWGAALCYFTGSAAHNIAMRQRAISAHQTLSEHGLWDDEKGRFIASRTEEDIFEALRLPWCPPELREGDILLPSIPELVSVDNVTTDWHMHTTFSDGSASPREMMAAAYARGLTEIGITDHSYPTFRRFEESAHYTQALRIWASRQAGLSVHVGLEVDILRKGGLDHSLEYSDQGYDYLIASRHIRPSRAISERMRGILRHPLVTVLGHPTGRLLERRGIPTEVDWTRVWTAAAHSGVLLEINGISERMDLPSEMVKEAKEIGCKFVLSSDAHSPAGLANLTNAIIVARRAGLTKDDLGHPAQQVAIKAGRRVW